MSPELRNDDHKIEFHVDQFYSVNFRQMPGQGSRQRFLAGILCSNTRVPELVFIDTKPDDSLEPEVPTAAACATIVRIHVRPDRQTAPHARILGIEERTVAGRAKPHAIRVQIDIERG